MPDTVSSFLTVKYKLHNPSKRRRALMLDAMRRAHLGYDKLLKAVREDVEAMVPIKERREHWDAMKVLAKKLQAIAKPLPLGIGPKQAIIADALAQAESYIELKKADENTSYPTTPRLKVEQSDHDAAIDGIANSQSILEENEYRDLLAKLSRPRLPRPLNILKNRISDGALLLQDDNGRLFVFINLLPQNAKRKRQVDLTGLIDTPTGEIMQKRTASGDIFPLEFGQWHDDKFLKCGTLQTSRLIYDGIEFYFAATFQFEAAIREPTNYIGVDRGLDLLAAWCVVDPQGNKIDGGYHSGEHLRSFQRRGEQEQKDTQRRGKNYSNHTRRAMADEEVHIAANKIVEAAAKHNAQVVLEDLQTITMGPHQKRPKGARKGGFRYVLTRTQYAKLKHCIDYRLQMEGFAPRRRGGTTYIEIHPAYTSQTCCKCAHKDKESRQGQAVFVCTKCGHEDNADLNAAVNVAAKGIHFNQVIKGRKKERKLKDHEQFSGWYTDMKSGGGVHADGP